MREKRERMKRVLKWIGERKGERKRDEWEKEKIIYFNKGEQTKQGRKYTNERNWKKNNIQDRDILGHIWCYIKEREEVKGEVGRYIW